MYQTNSLYVTSFITLERWTQLFIQQNTTKKEKREVVISSLSNDSSNHFSLPLHHCPTLRISLAFNVREEHPLPKSTTLHFQTQRP